MGRGAGRRRNPRTPLPMRSGPRDGSLQIIMADFELEPLPVHLIHAGRGKLPSKTRAFLDFAAGRLRQRLAS